jgi:hypothetical protein
VVRTDSQATHREGFDFSFAQIDENAATDYLQPRFRPRKPIWQFPGAVKALLPLKLPNVSFLSRSIRDSQIQGRVFLAMGVLLTGIIVSEVSLSRCQTGPSGVVAISARFVRRRSALQPGRLIIDSRTDARSLMRSPPSVSRA